MAVVTPDLPEIFEEAFERAGLSMTTGYDLKTARRSFNLLTLEWQNRGLNLWTINSDTISLTAGTATYTMPTGTIDILEHQIRTGTGTNQVDTDIQRISVSTYAKISSKNTRGKPSQVFVQRLATSTTLTLWPVPDEADTYTRTFLFTWHRWYFFWSFRKRCCATKVCPMLGCWIGILHSYEKPEVANRVAP